MSLWHSDMCLLRRRRPLAHSDRAHVTTRSGAKIADLDDYNWLLRQMVKCEVEHDPVEHCVSTCFRDRIKNPRAGLWHLAPHSPNKSCIY